MQKLKPIRTSPNVLWRRIRMELLPLLVFFAAGAMVLVQWRKLDGAGIPGLAEGVRSLVTSPRVGLLKDVKVRPYEWVEAGQPLATILPVDPQSRLDLLQSEMQLARLRLEPSLADQNALDYERLRVDSLRLRQELAMAEVNLQMAESALQRNTLLRADKLVSEDAYELSLRDRDMYRAEIGEKRKSLAEIDGRLAKLRELGDPEQLGTNGPLRAIVAELDGKILAVETNWCPVTLVAPISGMVYFVNRQPGEAVVEGEPLISINAARSDRIVGYLRQPYTIDPQPGMPVEVVTRTVRRQRFLSEISGIGAQVEAITNSLAVIRLGALVDVGLPIVVNVPPGVNVRPGEAVDILFRPGSSLSPRRPGPFSKVGDSP